MFPCLLYNLSHNFLIPLQYLYSSTYYNIIVPTKVNIANCIPLSILRTTMSSFSTNKDEPSKTEWPELVGKPVDYAKAQIERETNGQVKVFIIPPNSMVTMDYRLDRVRIMEDEQHKVSTVPIIG
jgi:hypothetical protein